MYQIPQKYTSKKKEKRISQVPICRGSIYAAPLLEKLSSHTLPFNQTSKAGGGSIKNVLSPNWANLPFPLACLL